MATGHVEKFDSDISVGKWRKLKSLEVPRKKCSFAASASIDDSVMVFGPTFLLIA